MSYLEMAVQEMDAPATPGPKVGTWAVSNDAYHADRQCVSHSALEVFRRSRPEYHGRYVTGTTPPRPPSESMVFGSAVDCLLLEPDEFEQRFALTPACDARTKAGKEIRDAFRAKLGDRTAIDFEDFQRAEAAVAAIWRNPRVRTMLKMEGTPQHSIRWQHHTGIWIKNRFDFLSASGAAIDLKTSRNPSRDAWAKDAHELGYHRQRSLYHRGRLATGLGKADTPFLYIVVGSQPPHECHVYDFGQDERALGDIENERDLSALAKCRKADNWNPPGWGEVRELKFPRYAFMDEGAA